MKDTQKQLIILTILLYVSYIVTMDKWGLIGDMEIWMNWSKYMHQNGLVKIYESGCDYLPGFLYILWLNTKIQHTATNVQDNLYLFKFLVLIFDFIGAYLAVYYVKDWNRKLFGYLFILLNIAYIYNTVVWGQVDAIFTCLGFASIITALNKKLIWSCILLVVALNFKLQALVFIPIVGLILLPQYLEKFSVVNTVKILIAICITQVLMLFPFLVKGHIADVWNVVSGSVGHYPYISVAAMNFWYLVIPGSIADHFNIPDSTLFIGIAYKNWGYILFFSFLLITVFPLLKSYYHQYLQEIPDSFPLEKIFLMSSLTAILFFYFNTEMHERYFHPALISLAAYTFLTSNYFPFVLGSLAYFLNLEKIRNSLALTDYNILIFHPVLIAVLFLILIVYLLYRLYSPKQFNDQILQLTSDE
jgi:Gpi18-like mannosyltransferase